MGLFVELPMSPGTSLTSQLFASYCKKGLINMRAHSCKFSHSQLYLSNSFALYNAVWGIKCQNASSWM